MYLSLNYKFVAAFFNTLQSWLYQLTHNLLYFLVSRNTRQKNTWRGTEITPSDLDVGDTISITFSGEILEIEPGQIVNVTKVQLLDDEM